MATHLQSSSPNKRPKTLAPNSRSPPSSISKGKSKVDEEPPPPIAENESADCCGICLSEAGVSRGHIDCCNHYYCFVCIMEWAKVESKCPLCKRRFSTIRRPPKPPVFATERLVQVPIRDQVCHYFGNATIGPPSLYSEVKCSICQGIADESLLLLCDLCDSSSHTYCVGLGYTVPEGDWFCQDCTLLRDEHLNSELNNDSDVQMSSVYKISTNEHISVSDIVRESRGHAVRRTGSASSDPCYLPPPTSTDDEEVLINIIKRSSSTSLDIVAQQPLKPNARTLRHCRNLHDRIRALRQNWNGFRSGVLRFSSNHGEGNISQNSVTLRSDESSVSCLNQQSMAQGSSSDVKNDTRNNEIQKAWEMFDQAKSIRQDCERSNIERQASKCLIRKLNPIRSPYYVSNRQVSLSQENGAKNVGSMGVVDHHNCSFEKDNYKQPSSSSGKGMSKLHVAMDVTYCREGSIIGHSTAHQELRCSMETISHPHNANTRTEKLSATKTLKRPQCLGSNASVVSNIDRVKGVNHSSSSHSKVKHAKEKRELEKIYVDSQQYNDAKSEIQSLVKLNLKLQTKEEKLDVDAFKEVARLATHSILAACGLEHPRPGSSSIPGNNICSHPNDIRQHQKSSLMPSSCRECFYAFVKDVVNSAVLQNKRTQKKPMIS
ncbi:hypothetical protein C2S52_001521 [Perilla frutescens var. hirtella]|nr:hypothetical protein C2S52_001521 [Perilla frutescens var. hirtella]